MSSSILKLTNPVSQWRTIIVASTALLCITIALIQLVKANAGVQVTKLWVDTTPVTIYRPLSISEMDTVPVVLISHGFAGSQQLMQAFAVTLSKSGYIAVTFDYYGHGRNLQPLGGDVTDIEGSTRLLLQQTGDMVDFALALPGADNRLALIGHSMATDVLVRYAQSDARVYATIAISLFSPAVTPNKPDNFLIIVGDLEGMLKKEAMRVLGMVTANPEPFITYGQFSDSSARKVVFADNVEHIGVLFSRQTMLESLKWLNQVFDKHQEDDIDTRGGPIALLFLGIVLFAYPLSRLLPTVSVPNSGAGMGWRRLLPVAILPALLTPLALCAFPADFLSLLVGGYLAVHFGVYGLLTIIMLLVVNSRTNQNEDTAVITTNYPKAIVATLAAVIYTTGIIAAAIDYYFTSFAITTLRLPLVFTMLLGTLCYFVADEWATRGKDSPAGAIFFTRFCFLVSLAIAVALSLDELFFLIIIAVVILIYFIIYGLFSNWIYKATGNPCVGAIASAFAFAWSLAAVFPLLSG